jgi:uncharacterized protein (DUF2252 family)
MARYQFCDAALRLVGTGSIGLCTYVILLHGNGDEALILQAKQARPCPMTANGSCTARG